jgi:hypothetical protein
LSTDDIKAADGEVQPVAETFPKHLHKREWNEETIIRVYDRCCHYHNILAVTIQQVDEGIYIK